MGKPVQIGVGQPTENPNGLGYQLGKSPPKGLKIHLWVSYHHFLRQSLVIVIASLRNCDVLQMGLPLWMPFQC